MTCDGCGGAAPLHPTAYGLLCARCEFAQFDHEERAGEALAASTYGFRYDDE